jgi:CheY-like chemotaxis protein
MNEFACLLIDDDVDDHEIFLSVLEAVAPAATCITALNGQDALDKLLRQDVKPDIIFLDLNMPLMNGRQFLEEVRRRDIINGIPIVLLTTSSDQRTKDSLLALGAREFITKPDRLSQWESLLSRVIETNLSNS